MHNNYATSGAAAHAAAAMRQVDIVAQSEFQNRLFFFDLAGFTARQEVHGLYRHGLLAA
jgi:hypothetical protein